MEELEHHISGEWKLNKLKSSYESSQHTLHKIGEQVFD